jgi:hypothetical protein
VADNATANAGLIGFTQGAITLTSQLTETMLRIDPESQIEITAFVPNLYTLVAELPESWNFLPQRICDRSYHRNRLNLRKTCPSLCHHIGGDPELALACQH